jgi:hypothetical protein
VLILRRRGRIQCEVEVQMGIPENVALMGGVKSQKQADIIAELVTPKGTVWPIPDGDESGRRCAKEVS